MLKYRSVMAQNSCASHTRGDMIASKISQSIEQVRPEMMAIKKEFEQPDAAVVALFEQACDIANRDGIDCLRTEKIHSKYMYVCMENRYGDGVVPSDVMDLIHKIFKNGFKNSALQNPVCMELPPLGTSEYQTIKVFNDKIIQDSAGQLPAYDCDAKFASYTCGHTSMGLRCLSAGVRLPSDKPERFEKISQDGSLSLKRLRETQPEYARAVTEGIEWKVFRYEFVREVPWISNLAQEAGNAGQQIARCESRTSLMFKIASIANRQQNQDGTVNWEKVIREATRAGSLFPGEIDGLVTYVKELSGGLGNPIFLNELRDFARQLTSHCVVTGTMAKALAEVQIKSEGAAATFRIACMKAMACATGKYARDGHQLLLRPADVSALSGDKKSTIALHADAFLQKVREIAKREGVTADTLAFGTMVGLTDVRVVHFVFNKPDERLGSAKTLNEIGASFCAALATHTGRAVDCPWAVKPDASKDNAKAAGSSSSSGVKQFDEAGAWSNQSERLAASGFRSGAMVRQATDTEAKQVYEFVGVEAAGVKLKIDKREVFQSVDDFLKGKFVLNTFTKDLRSHRNPSLYCFDDTSLSLSLSLSPSLHFVIPPSPYVPPFDARIQSTSLLSTGQ